MKYLHAGKLSPGYLSRCSLQYVTNSFSTDLVVDEGSGPPQMYGCSVTVSEFSYPLMELTHTSPSSNCGNTAN